MFSESHCHLARAQDHPGPRSESDEVVKNAKNVGVELVVTAGVDVASSEEVVKTAKEYNIVKGCVGIHPWRADTFSQEALKGLREMAGELEVVAISEIGLDFVGRMNADWVYTEEYVDRETQRTAFRQQIRLAKELGLPVLVHDRVPNEEVLDILKEESILEVGAAIHGFSKGPEYARRCVEMGIFLSIGKRTLERGDEDFIEAVRQTPLKWLLTETDSAEPSGVISVAEKISELKGLTRDEVGRTTTNNLKKLLNL